MAACPGISRGRIGASSHLRDTALAEKYKGHKGAAEHDPNRVNLDESLHRKSGRGHCNGRNIDQSIDAQFDQDDYESTEKCRNDTTDDLLDVAHLAGFGVWRSDDRRPGPGGKVHVHHAR